MKKRFKTLSSYGFYLLGRREYSVTEFRGKLQNYFGIEKEEEIEELINNFVQKNFLSDARFIDTFIKYHLKRKKGPLYIKKALYQKGISAKIAEKYITDQIPETLILEQIKEAIMSRKRKTNTNQEKAALIRYLLGKGFPFDMIQKVL